MKAVDELSALHRRWIDCLVTGDLMAVERRELMKWLDENPVRWRHCGQAFLEAQLWEQALSPVAREAAAPAGLPRPGPNAEPIRRHMRPLKSWRNATAIGCTLALGILLLFGAGFSMGRYARPPAAAPNASPQRSTNITSAQSAVDSQPGLVVDARQPEQSRDSPARSAVTSDTVVAMATWDSLPVAVSNAVRTMLEQRGFELQQMRRLIPVRLDDGRRVVVPVDAIRVTYVGRHTS